MDPDLPQKIYFVFLLTTLSLLALIIFAVGFNRQYKGTKYQWITGIVAGAWLLISGYMAYTGFFTQYEVIPPRMAFGIVPPFLTVIVLLAIRNTRLFLIQIPLFTLTYLHLVRIPVEIVLWWLHKQGLVPEMMTFEGANWDILSGITAPFVAHFLNDNNPKHRPFILLWNLLALGLLFNVVIRGILSAPYVTQMLAFDQPNTGVTLFPFIWLPVFIVPLVLLSHIVAIIKVGRRV